MNFDVEEINDIIIADVDTTDAPDFSEAFIEYATYKGNDLSDVELDKIKNENPDWFYEQVINTIY